MNENCLEGLACPRCGHYSHFYIAGTALFSVFDDGTDEHYDVEWNDKSYIRCSVCDFEGKLGEFRKDLQ